MTATLPWALTIAPGNTSLVLKSTTVPLIPNCANEKLGKKIKEEMQMNRILYLAIKIDFMRKSLLSIILFCTISCAQNLFGQCTPDTTLKTSGTFPAILDTAKIGQLYSQVIQYYITKDTNVFVPQLGQNLNARIDTLRILNVVGMPSGFSYSCHNAQCKIVGGTTGCAMLTGTPTAGQAGIYPLLVIVGIRATAFLGRVPVVQNVVDTNARYAIIVQGSNGTAELNENQKILIYPNPVANELQFYVPSIKSNLSYQIKDLQGKVLLEGLYQPINEVKHLSTENLNDGIYFLELRDETQTFTKKFVINRN